MRRRSGNNSIQTPAISNEPSQPISTDDTGPRRGTDILKALALGAPAVLIGRPVLWGLSVQGADGVAAVIEHLRVELVRAMQLSGTASLRDIGPDLIAAN